MPSTEDNFIQDHHILSKTFFGTLNHLQERFSGTHNAAHSIRHFIENLHV